ncbi:unnamed protein product [Rotaria socialis]
MKIQSRLRCRITAPDRKRVRFDQPGFDVDSNIEPNKNYESASGFAKQNSQIVNYGYVDGFKHKSYHLKNSSQEEQFVNKPNQNLTFHSKRLKRSKINYSLE